MRAGARLQGLADWSTTGLFLLLRAACCLTCSVALSIVILRFRRVFSVLRSYSEFFGALRTYSELFGALRSSSELFGVRRPRRRTHKNSEELRRACRRTPKNSLGNALSDNTALGIDGNSGSGQSALSLCTFTTAICAPVSSTASKVNLGAS